MRRVVRDFSSASLVSYETDSMLLLLRSRCLR